jgi:hypothetical protein
MSPPPNKTACAIVMCKLILYQYIKLVSFSGPHFSQILRTSISLLDLPLFLLELGLKFDIFLANCLHGKIWVALNSYVDAWTEDGATYCPMGFNFVSRRWHKSYINTFYSRRNIIFQFLFIFIP